jgi:hypothetical protein
VTEEEKRLCIACMTRKLVERFLVDLFYIDIEDTVDCFFASRELAINLLTVTEVLSLSLSLSECAFPHRRSARRHHPPHTSMPPAISLPTRVHKAAASRSCLHVAGTVCQARAGRTRARLAFAREIPVEGLRPLDLVTLLLSCA